MCNNQQNLMMLYYKMFLFSKNMFLISDFELKLYLSLLSDNKNTYLRKLDNTLRY